MSNESVLREKARELIRSGKLPDRLPKRMWGGPGIGSQCMVCGAPVTHDELGLEIEYDGPGATSHHFHVRCFSALEYEVSSRDPARQTISAGDEVPSPGAYSMPGGRQNRP